MNIIKMKKSLWLLLIAIFTLNACIKSNEYQKQVAIPEGIWNSSLQPEFEIEITDSVSKYDVFVLLRNDNRYSISNLWLKIYILAPGASTYKIYDRVELVLSDSKGNWLGRNFGNFWELKSPIALNDNSVFNKVGVYKVKFEHIMRTDPLIGIHNIGLNLTRK
jgi:gliding motility-associated lipoprotein GldH